MPMMEHPRLLSDSTAILAPGYRAVSKGDSNSVHDSPENFFASSGAPPSMWDSVSMIGGGDEEGLEMITELGEDGDDDEEVSVRLVSLLKHLCLRLAVGVSLSVGGNISCTQGYVV